MYDHLWTNGPAPWDYIELVLCRDLYHCTPLELEEVPLETILKHLACVGVEGEVKRIKAEQTNNE